VAAVLAGLLAAAVFASAENPGNVAQIGYPIERRGLIWAVVGAALGLWLALRSGRANPGWRALQGLLIGAIAGALGGAIVALPEHLPDPGPLVKGTGSGADWLEVASVAVTGGLIGAWIGSLWSPASRGLGFASGAGAGAVIAIIYNWVGWGPTPSDNFQWALTFGIRAAVIAGVVVATMALASRRAAADDEAELAAAVPSV
jgi:hypothetical protein